MLSEIPYNRKAVLKYAKKWALKRNPKYYNFDLLGGDCTNFCSQCIYAGCKAENYTKTFGWYYSSLDDRTPSWSGVEFLYKFLIENKGTGPFGVNADISQLEEGDIIQLGNNENHYYHSLVVTDTTYKILVSAHTFDCYMRPLLSYSYDNIRGIHILGARKYI